MQAGMWVQLWFACSSEFEKYYNNFLIVHWWSQRVCWFPFYEPDLCPLLKRSKYICKIWGSHSCDYEYNHVLGCDVRNKLALCKHLLSLYSTVKTGCGRILTEVCQSLPHYIMSHLRQLLSSTCSVRDQDVILTDKFSCK
jgi:hypothetical protein